MSAADDDRDRRRVKTPPAGVRAQVAPPVEEATWESPDDATPPLGLVTTTSQLHRIGRSIKATAQTAQVTSDRVDLLRLELRGDVVRVDGKVDALAEHVADLRQVTGQIGGKLDALAAAVQEDREERAQERRQHATMRVTAFAAEVEVDKTRQLSQIDVDHSAAISKIEADKERRRHRRELVYRVMAGIGAVWAVVSAIALARCH